MNELDELREKVRIKKEKELELAEIKRLREELEKDSAKGKAKKVLKHLWKKI